MALGINRHGNPTSEALDELHEINVTPFIDVMLVLLIIFMVAAPLATVDINVDLPASTAEKQPRPDTPVYLTMQADLTLALGGQPVSDGNALRAAGYLKLALVGLEANALKQAHLSDRAPAVEIMNEEAPPAP